MQDYHVEQAFRDFCPRLFFHLARFTTFLFTLFRL